MSVRHWALSVISLNLHPGKWLFFPLNTMVDPVFKILFSAHVLLGHWENLPYVIPYLNEIKIKSTNIYWPQYKSLWGHQFSSVQSLSRVRICDPVNRSTPGLPVHHPITSSGSSLRLTSIESVMPSSHLILCRPLFLLPPIPPSIRVFYKESTLSKKWPKYWSFSFNIIPSKEHPGLISFRMDWFNLLAIQGTLKSLLQHHSSKASVLRRWAFFTVQLSHPYMTTGKTIALDFELFSLKTGDPAINDNVVESGGHYT